MTAPVAEKTYQYAANILCGNTGTRVGDYRTIWWNLKNTLVTTFVTSPWTVIASSSQAAVKAVGDASPDLWASAANINWAAAGSAHSWIVLEQTGIISGGHFQICLDCAVDVNGDDIGIYCSPGGQYTGGLTTAKPTAADEVTIFTAGLWYVASTFGPARMQIMQSTDGQVTRAAMMSLVGSIFYLAFETPKNPMTGWTTPWFGTFAHGNGNFITYATLYASSANTKSVIAATTCPLYYTSVGWANLAGSQRVPQANNITGEEFLGPVGLASETVNGRGRVGEIYDLWWGSSYMPIYENYPAGTSRTFAHWGNLVVPWNGSIITLG